MKVLIDGKEIEALNDVKVIMDGDIHLSSEPEGDDAHMQLTITHEGLIIDVFKNSDNQIYSTASLESQDLSDFTQ